MVFMFTTRHPSAPGKAQPPKRRFIGYWKIKDPADFIDLGWDSVERAEVVRRLKLSTVYVAWRGYSGCRLCDFSRNGTTCRMFDGSWVFPEGFVHYLEEHSVKPPQEFINYVLYIPQALLCELQAHIDNTQAILDKWEPRMDGKGRPEGYCEHTPSGWIEGRFDCKRGNSTYGGRCQWAVNNQLDEFSSEGSRHRDALLALGANLKGSDHLSRFL